MCVRLEIQALVHRKNRVRKGKGFSKAELKEVNINSGSALKMGIPIDSRRRSKHVENVELLRRCLEDLKTLDRTENKNMG